MDNEKKNLLEIRDLTVEYHTNGGVVHAVNGLNLEVAPKETLGFVGETGAGKTTTALSILNLLPHPQGKVISGSIKYNGEEILNKSNKDMTRIRGEKISMIFQDPMTSLNPVMTVGDQIAEGIRLHDHLSKADAHKKALEMLKTVGIRPERASDYPHQFSGGMKQRVMIAIALVGSPSIVIADEPTTSLDVTIEAQILELLKNLQKTLGTSIILITHDLGVIAKLCDRVLVMYGGKIVERGTAEEIFYDTAHPYTKGLMQSIARLDTAKGEKLKPIEGTPPDLFSPPVGCPFAARCEYCMDICNEMPPETYDLSGEHETCCWLQHEFAPDSDLRKVPAEKGEVE